VRRQHGGHAVARSLIGFTPEAAQHVRDLRENYRSKQRPEAVRNLMASLDVAGGRILAAPLAGLPAPRPYPGMARSGRRWIKEGRYWIAYRLTDPPVIVGVFFDTADIPGRQDV
jgi:plasmid stabilization system protein ParE